MLNMSTYWGSHEGDIQGGVEIKKGLKCKNKMNCQVTKVRMETETTLKIWSDITGPDKNYQLE